MDHDQAVKALRSPATWCNGAAALVALGDVRAVRPLMAAYESRPETGKGCLLDAMEELDGSKQAAVLMAAEGAQDRRIGAHLAELFASDDQLAPLLTAAHDNDVRVRAQALRSLGVQKQTTAWEQTMVKLLESDHVQLRSMATDKLATRYTDSARAALGARLDREADTKLRASLVVAIERNKDHKRQ